MNLEKYIPEESRIGEKPSLFERIKSKLLRLENPPFYREFYNSDKTRKFVFYEWREDDFR